MTPRPSLSTHKRPSSAIFIGNGKTPLTLPGSNSLDSVSSSHLPELPDPPSPSSSSGLPSPPATNSTSSNGSARGSSQAGGSIRRRPVSFSASDGVNQEHESSVPTSSHSDASGGRGGGSGGSRASGGRRSQVGSDDEDDEDNDEDHTARMTNERRRSARFSADSTLARVRSLNERNRQVLDKLSSLSGRTASPSAASRSARSPPNGSVSASSSSSSTASTSRLSSHSSSRHEPRQQHEQPSHSGSETERDDHIDDDVSVTPPSAVFRSQYNTDLRSHRISAPPSPAKLPARLAASDRPPSSSGARKRVSLVEDRVDLTAAALAAVANSRRSPPNGKRARPSLPREFRDQNGSDGRSGSEQGLVPQHTDDRDRAVSPGVLSGRGSPDPTSSGAMLANDSTMSPRPTRINRSSLVREMARRYSQRHLSQDLSDLSFEGDVDDEPVEPIPSGRQQGVRRGSTDSALALATPNGRSLLGQGLRAAGLTKRQDEVFAPPLQRTRLSGGLGTRPTLDSWGESSDTRSTTSTNRSSNRRSVEFNSTPRTPSRRTAARERGMESQPRPVTSMAYTVDPPRSAPPMARQRSALPALGHEREPAERQPRSNAGPSRQERNYTSPAPGRISSLAAQFAGGGGNNKHNQIMVDSLARFELQLTRLQPTLNSLAAATIPDVTRAAQSLVHSANMLNSQLHDGVENALNSQISADVSTDDIDQTSEASQIWGEVGSDLRENARVSDEMVRSMTQFMLGVVNLIRETTNPGQHERSVSLDDSVIQRQVSDSSAVPSSAGGRRSVGSDRSGEYHRHGMDRNSIDRDRASHRSLSRTESRPVSVLSQIRDPTYVETPQRRTPATLSNAARRLYSPRDQQDRANGNPSIFDQSMSTEPSPTPAARTTTDQPRRRTLPPLAIPPPLPTLPSESLLRRNTSLTKTPVVNNSNGNTSANNRDARRNKGSTASNATVHAPPFPLMNTPNSTTAVTPLSVSNTPNTNMIRSVSSDSPNVTFSRPSKDSSAALNDLHERDDRRRTISVSSAVGAPPLVTSISGSETERERDYRSSTHSAQNRASLETAPRDRDRDRDRGRGTIPPTRKERRRTVTEVFTR